MAYNENLFHFKAHIAFYIKITLILMATVALTAFSIALSFAFIDKIESDANRLMTHNFYMLNNDADAGNIEQRLKAENIEYAVAVMPQSNSGESILIGGKNETLYKSYSVRFIYEGVFPTVVNSYLTEEDNPLIVYGKMPDAANEIVLPLEVVSQFKSIEKTEDIIGKSVSFNESPLSYLNQTDFTVSGVSKSTQSSSFAYYLFFNIVINIDSSVLRENEEIAALPTYTLLYFNSFDDAEKAESIIGDGGGYYGNSVKNEYVYTNAISVFSKYAFAFIDVPFLAAFLLLLFYICSKFLNAQRQTSALKLSLGATKKTILAEYGGRFSFCFLIAFILSSLIAVSLVYGAQQLFTAFNIYLTMNIKVIGVSVLCSFLCLTTIAAITLLPFLYKLKRTTAMQLIRE